MAASTISFGRPHLVRIRDRRSVMVEIRAPGAATDLPRGFQTVLFLHGAMANRRQFYPLAKEFEDLGVSVVMYDALGCSDSDKPDDWQAYSEEQMKQDAAEVLRRYCAGAVLVIAHSFGANIAVQLAALPDLQKHIVGMVVIGCSLKRPMIPPIFWLPEWILECFRQPLNRAFLRAAFSPHADRALLAETWAECDRNPWHVVRPFYRQLSWGATEAAKSVQVPCLCIVGQADGISPPEDCDNLHRVLSDASFVLIHDASHQVMQEKPRECMMAITAFLRDRGLV
jgi:pimeloyl-ACP methyl ester carboxylesterase